MSVFSVESKNKFDIFSKDFWVKIIIMTIAIWIVSFTGLVTSHDGPHYLLLAALIISLLNAFLRPILSFISLPLVVSTFGIFMLVINAIIILLTSALLGEHFIISGFGNAFFFSIIVTILTSIMNLPRKIKKVQNHMFNNEGQDNHIHQSRNENTNQDTNSTTSNRFDENPFNDNPQDKNYTDYEDVN